MKKDNAVLIILFFAFFPTLFLAYSNHFQNAFHFDDSHTIVDNTFIRDIHNIPLFFRDSRTFSSNPANQNYRPLTTATFAVDYWLGDGLKSTFYFHLSTFLSYGVLCILLYLLFLHIFNSAVQHQWNRYAAFFGAAWYGLHTANAETVNYICQRADILSTLMVVSGLVLYAYAPRLRNRYLYLAPFVIGMFIKEPTAVFAPLLFLYILFFERKCSISDGLKPANFIAALRESLPAFLVALAMGIFVIKMKSPTYSPGGASAFHYLLTQPFVMAHYFMEFFLPFNLTADSDWKVVTKIFDERVFAGILFILAMLFVAHQASKKQETRPVSFGILWFFIALLPTSSFIPLAEVMNDHRMFFPFIGLTISACWISALLLVRQGQPLPGKPGLRTFMIFVAAVVLAGHAYGTHARNEVWRTEESLWYDVTVKSPNNGRGLMNYGLSQMEKGNYPVAQEYFEKALVLTPYYSYLHVNLAVLKGAMNDPIGAERHFRNAIHYGPANPEAYFFYARWLCQNERPGEAVQLLERTLQLSPAHNSAKLLLAGIRSSRHDAKEADAATERHSGAGRTAEDYLNLSLQFHKAGRYSESIKACTEALRIRPDYDLAYNNICAAYNEMKVWDKAVAACEKGLRINPSSRLLKNNLAVSRFGKAKQSSVD